MVQLSYQAVIQPDLCRSDNFKKIKWGGGLSNMRVKVTNGCKRTSDARLKQRCLYTNARAWAQPVVHITDCSTRLKRKETTNMLVMASARAGKTAESGKAVTTLARPLNDNEEIGGKPGG